MRAFGKSAIIQRLQPLQNYHFWSKIKIPKNMSKSILKIIQSCSVQKPARKNIIYLRNGIILKIGHYAKAITFEKLSLQVKNSKSIQQIIQSSSVQKTARKNIKQAIMQRLQPLQNDHFGSKIKIPQNISISILKLIQGCSGQKTARKNIKYSRNESIWKIGHHLKAIASAKLSLWFKN